MPAKMNVVETNKYLKSLPEVLDRASRSPALEVHVTNGHVKVQHYDAASLNQKYSHYFSSEYIFSLLNPTHVDQNDMLDLIATLDYLDLHKKQEEHRNKIREFALFKLTDEEKEVLGLV